MHLNQEDWTAKQTTYLNPAMTTKENHPVNQGVEPEA